MTVIIKKRNGQLDCPKDNSTLKCLCTNFKKILILAFHLKFPKSI